jgi:hypothetical protein
MKRTQHGSPRLLKGGIVLTVPVTSAVQRIIAFGRLKGSGVVLSDVWIKP